MTPNSFQLWQKIWVVISATLTGWVFGIGVGRINVELVCLIGGILWGSYLIFYLKMFPKKIGD